jgi:hypothetical protein
MEVTKSQLGFLEKFVSASDTRNPLNKMVNIEVVDGTAHFSLKTDSIAVHTSIELLEKCDSFSVFLPVKALADLIKTLPEDSEVTIKENVISFKGGSYALEAMTDAMPLLREIQNYESAEHEEVALCDLSKFELISGFNGIDDSGSHDWFEATAVINGYFITSDGVSVAMTKTRNDSRKLVLPRSVTRLFSQMPEDLVSLKLFQNGWMNFSVDGVQYFVPEKKSSIRDLWATTSRGDTFYERLNIAGNVFFEKAALKPVLQRLALVVSDKSKKAMSVKFQKGKAILGSVGYNISSEVVECSYGEELEGVQKFFSFPLFNSMYQSLEGDKVIIGASPLGHEEVVNITVQDENQSILGFIKLFNGSAYEEKTEEAA